MPKHAPFKEHEEFKYNRVPTLRSFYSRDGTPPDPRKRPQPPPPPTYTPAPAPLAAVAAHLLRPRPTYVAPAPLDTARAPHLDMRCFLEQLYLQRGYPYRREEPQFDYYILPSESRDPTPSYPCEVHFDSYPAANPVIHREYRIPNILERGLREEWANADHYGERSDEAKLLQSSLSSRSDEYASPRKRKLRVKKKKRHRHDENEMEKRRGWYPKSISRKRAIGARKTVRSNNSTRIYECVPGSKTTIDESLGLDSDARMLLTEYESVTISSKDVAKKHHRTHSSSRRRSSFNKEQGGKVIFIETDFSSKSKADSSIHSCHRKNIVPAITKEIKKKISPDSETPDSAFCSRNKTSPSSNNISKEEIREIVADQTKHAPGTSVTQTIERRQQSFTSSLYKPQDVVCTRQKVEEMGVVIEELDHTEPQEKNNELQSPLSVLQFSYIMPENEQEIGGQYVPAIQSEPNLTVISGNEISNYWNNAVKTAKDSINRQKTENMQEKESILTERISSNELQIVEQNLNNLASKTNDCITSSIASFTHETENRNTPIKSENEEVPPQVTIEPNKLPQNFVASQNVVDSQNVMRSLPTKLLFDDFARSISKEVEIDLKPKEWSNQANSNKLNHLSDQNTREETTRGCEKVLEIIDLASVDHAGGVTQENEKNVLQPSENVISSSDALQGQCISGDRQELVKINNRVFRICEGNTFQEVPSNVGNKLEQNILTDEDPQLCEDPFSEQVVSADFRKILSDKNCISDQLVNSTNSTNAVNNLASIPWTSTRTKLTHSPQIIELNNEPTWEKKEQPSLESIAGEMVISTHEPSTFSLRTRTISEPAGSVCDNIICNVKKYSTLLSDETNFISMRKDIEDGCESLSSNVRGVDNATENSQQRISSPEQHSANNVNGVQRELENTVLKKTLHYRGNQIPLKRFEKFKISELQNKPLTSTESKIAIEVSELPFENLNIPIGYETRTCTTLDTIPNLNGVGDRHFEGGESPKAVNYSTTIGVKHSVSVEKVLVVSDKKEQTFKIKGPNNNFPQELQRLCNAKKASREYINVSQHIFKCPLMHAVNCSDINSTTRASDSSIEISSQTSSTQSSEGSTPPTRKFGSLCSDQSCNEEESSSSSHFSKEETPSANVSVSSLETRTDSTAPGVMIWEMCNKKMYRDNDVTMFMRASAGEIFMERHPFANISNGIINSNDIEFSSEKTILPSITEEHSSRVLKGSIEELSLVKQDEGESVVGLLQQIVRHLSCIGRQQSASSCSAASSLTHRSAVNSIQNIRHSDDKIMNSCPTISDVHMNRLKCDQMRSIRQNAEVDHQEELIIPTLPKNNDLNCQHFNGSKHTSKQNSFEKSNECKSHDDDSLEDGGTYYKCTSEIVENDNFHKRSNKNVSHILGSCDLHKEYLIINRDSLTSNATSENPRQINLNNAVSNSKIDLNIGSNRRNDSNNVTRIENDTTVALPFNKGDLTDSLNLSLEGNRIRCLPLHTSQDREAPETENDGLCTFISPSSPSSTDLEGNVKSCLVHCEGKQTSEELKQFRLSGGSSPTADRIHLHHSGKWNICSSGSDRSQNQYLTRRPSSEQKRSFPSRSFRRSSQKHQLTDEGHAAKYLGKHKYSDTSEKDIRKSSKSHRTHRLPTYISRAKGDERDTIPRSRKFYTRDTSDSSNESSRSELSRSRTGSRFESIPEYPYSSSSSSDEPSQRRTRRCCKRRDRGLEKSAKRCISCILKNIPTLTSHLILNENNFESENAIAKRAHSVSGKSNIRALYAQTYAKPNYQMQKQLPSVEEFLKINESPSSPIRRKLAYSASAPRSSTTEQSFTSNDPTSMASAGILDEMKLCIDRIEERCIKIEKNYKASSEKSSRSLSPQSGYHGMCTDSPISLSQPQPPSMTWSAEGSRLSTPNSEGNSSVPRDKITDEENTCAYHQAIQRKFKPFSHAQSERLFAIECARRLSKSTQAEFKKPDCCEMGVVTDIAQKCKFCEMKTQTEEFKLYEKGIQVIIEEILGVAMTSPIIANKYKDQKRNLRDSCVQWEYPEEELRQISLETMGEIKHELCDSAVQCAIMGHGKLISQSSQTDFKVRRSKSVQSDSINLVESGIQSEISEVTSRGVQANAPTESSVQVLKKKDSFSQTVTMNEVFFAQEMRPASRPKEYGQCDRQDRNSCLSDQKCITCPERFRDREGPQSQGPGGPGRSRREYEPSGQDGRQRMPRFKLCKRCDGVHPPCARENSTCPNTYLVDDATQRRIEESMRNAPSGGADTDRYKDLVCKCPPSSKDDEDAHCMCPKDSGSYPSQKYPRDEFPSKTAKDDYGRPPSDRRYDRPSDARLYRPPPDDRYEPAPYAPYGPPPDDGRYPRTSRDYGQPPSDRRRYGSSDSKDIGRPPPDSKRYVPPPRDYGPPGKPRDYGPPPSEDERGYGPPPSQPRGYGPPPKDGRDYGPPRDERDYTPSEVKRYQTQPDERDYGKRPRDGQDYDTRPLEAPYYGPPRDRKQFGPPPPDSRVPPRRDVGGYDSPRYSADRAPPDGRYGPPSDDRQIYPPSESYGPLPGDTKYGPARDRRPPPEEDDSTKDVSDKGDRAPYDYGPPPEDIRQRERRGPDDDEYPPSHDPRAYAPPREQMPSRQPSAYADYAPGRGPRRPSREYPPSERDTHYPPPSDDYPPPRGRLGGSPIRERSPDGQGTDYDPQSVAYRAPSSQDEPDGRAPDRDSPYREPTQQDELYDRAPGRDPYERPPDRDGPYRGPAPHGEPYDRARDGDGPYREPPLEGETYDRPPGRDPYKRPPDDDGPYREPPPQDVPYDKPPGRDTYEGPPDDDGPYRGPPPQVEPYGRAPGRDYYEQPPDGDRPFKGPPPHGGPYDRDPGRDAYERPPDDDIPFRGTPPQGEPYDRPPVRGSYERPLDRDGPYRGPPPQGEPYDRASGRDPYGRPPDRDGPYRGPPLQGEPYDKPPGRGPYERPPDDDGPYREPPPQGEPYDRTPVRGSYERPPDGDGPYRGAPTQGEPYDRAPSRDPYERPPDRDGAYRGPLPPQGEPYDRGPGRDPYERPPDRDGPYRGPPPQGEPYDRTPGRGPYEKPPDDDGPYREPPPQGEPYDRAPGRGPYERPPDDYGPYREPPPQGEPYDRAPGRGPYERPPDGDDPYRGPRRGGGSFGKEQDPYRQAPPRGDPYGRPPSRSGSYERPSSRGEPYGELPPGSRRPGEPDGEPYERSRPPSAEHAYPPGGERPYGPPPHDAQRDPWQRERDPRAPDDEKELRVWSSADRSRSETPRPCEDEDCVKRRKQKRKGFWRCFRRKPRQARESSPSRSPPPGSAPPESLPPSRRSSRSRPQSGPSSRPDRRQDDEFERGSSRPPSAPPRTETPTDGRPRKDTSPCDERCERPPPPPRDAPRDPNESSRRPREYSQDPYEYPTKKEKKKGKSGGGSRSSSSSDRKRYKPPPRDSYQDHSSRRPPPDRCHDTCNDSRPSRRYSSPRSEEESERHRKPKKKKRKSKCGHKHSKSRSSHCDSRDTYDSPRDRSRDPYDSRSSCDPSNCPRSGREPRDRCRESKRKKRKCGRQRSKHRTPRRDSRDSHSYDSPRPRRESSGDPYNSSRRPGSPSETTSRPSRPRRRDSYDDSRPPRGESYSEREPSDRHREPKKRKKSKCGRQRHKYHSPRRDSRDPCDSSCPPRDRSEDPYDYKRPRRDPYDSSGPPRDSTRDPYDSSRPRPDASRDPYYSPRPSRDASRDPYYSSRPSRDSSREPYVTASPPRKQYRDSYETSRPERGQPREPYDSPNLQRSSPGKGSICVPECEDTDGTRQPESKGSRLVCVNDPAKYQSSENVIFCDDLNKR